jgi:hypothetical protein
MTDTELDRLLRSADPAARLTAPAPPPFQEEAPVVPLRSRWLPAVGAAAAVAAVVGLAVVTTGSGRGTSAAGPDVTGRPTATPAASAQQPDLGRSVFAAVLADLPPGYRLTGGTWRVPAPTSSGRTGYQAHATVQDGTRSAVVEVTYQTRMPAADLCSIAAKLHGAGTCRLVRTAAGRTVAVTDADPAYGDPGATTQWALYRHPDSSIVLVAQGSGSKEGQRPWSAARLAGVATDPAFRR